MAKRGTKRIPKLSFTNSRGIGWHVTYRDLTTGLPRKLPLGVRERERENERRDRLPYSMWIRQGLITATEGNMTDYEVIREQIDELKKQYDIEEIAFDPFGATEMVAKLMRDGFEMVEFRQNIQTINEPTQKLEALITAGQIEHGVNPVLRAHAQAATVKTDLNENIRPFKDRNTGRIDGIVALIMALSRAIKRLGPNDYPRAFVLEW